MPKKEFCSPFSKEFWRSALLEVKNVRSLAFAALMIAAYVLLGMFFIPVGDSLRVTFKFIASALLGLVCGPIMGLGAGILGDTLAYLIYPTGVYFPGYTLSAMLSFFIFAMFFYRQKITLWRAIASKTLVNYAVNVALGVWWNSILLGKGYMYYLATSATKNTIMLPIEILLLMLLMKALAPSLESMGLIPKSKNK